MSQYNKRPLSSWYKELASERQHYIDRAERASQFTLPWFIAKEGTKDSTHVTPYQSVGAEGVTNLASRLVMVLMPPNRPLFRLNIARRVVAEAAMENKEQLLTEVNNGLSRIERDATALIEATGDRTNLYTAMLHLLISGNVLLNIMPDSMKVYSIKNYVVQRDADGNVLTIIIKESVAYAALPEKIKRIVRNNITSVQKEEQTFDPIDYDIYTCIHRHKDQWQVWQECQDTSIGKAGTYPIDACPWLPLRLYRSEEEDYGRGYVEQFAGDFHSLSVLSKAITQAAAAAAKVVFLVHPASTTNVQSLVDADNLGFVSGKKDDIDVLQLEKVHDFQTAKALITELTQRLSKAFLLNSAIQRDAERVTAEEIRYMAQELETALGGLYSMLAKEFQKPYISLRLAYFQESGKINPFPEGVQTEIITGVDALGRGQEANTLMQFGQAVFKTLPPENVIGYMNIGGYLKALAAAYGIDDTMILKSEKQVAEEQAQAQQMQLLQKAAPNMVNAGADLLKTQMTPTEGDLFNA